MNYSSLNTMQREQVAFLFCDEIFGTNPNEYEYELNGETVVGRCKLTAISSELLAHVRKAHAVAVNVVVRDTPSRYVTLEMSRTAQITIEEIARSILARLVTNQVEA